MLKTANHNWLCDLLFILIAACFAWLCLQGILEISVNGAFLDSDLQTYAQGMAGAAQPELFVNDPVLHSQSAANSIPNLERLLAEYLMPADGYAIGLLRAGALAIFIFYTGWYLLGRYVFGAPALAALLAILSGITVWVGWGTFWGVTHSDPVPRVFFAALYPFLLLYAVYSINHVQSRPVCMFLTGLAIWVHGINALNCGAMFFMAFLFIKSPKATWKYHFKNLFLCLIAFFMPVIIFLWPTLNHGKNFSPEELSVFQEMFNLRWQKDFVGFGKRFIDFFHPANPNFPILVAGFAGWLITLFAGNEKEKTLCKLIPPFLLALFLVSIFCWFESWSAQSLGRLPIGHELVRGMRYLIPFSWLMIVAGVSCFTGKIFRRLILIVTLALILIFNVDRQYAAAQYAFWTYTGLKLPLVDSMIDQKKEAEKYNQLMLEINKIVPPNEVVFSAGEDMAVRYLAHRPLFHTFKDGYIFFYNKDFQGVKNWLEYEKRAGANREGLIPAWRESGAQWLLCPESRQNEAEQYGTVVLQKDGFLLIHRN